MGRKRNKLFRHRFPYIHGGRLHPYIYAGFVGCSYTKVNSLLLAFMNSKGDAFRYRFGIGWGIGGKSRALLEKSRQLRKLRKKFDLMHSMKWHNCFSPTP